MRTVSSSETSNSSEEASVSEVVPEAALQPERADANNDEKRKSIKKMLTIRREKFILCSAPFMQYKKSHTDCYSQSISYAAEKSNGKYGRQSKKAKQTHCGNNGVVMQKNIHRHCRLSPYGRWICRCQNICLLKSVSLSMNLHKLIFFTFLKFSWS